MRKIFKASSIAGIISALLSIGISYNAGVLINATNALLVGLKSFLMAGIITFVAIAIVYGMKK